MDRNAILRQLSALDFYAVDLHLFLDTHPNDREALAKFNEVVTEADVLRKEYEKTYGPLTSYRVPSKFPWQWPSDPWPWQNEFNFKLAGDEF